MSKREKRLQKIRQNPRNVSFEDLRQVLEDHGFVVDRQSGSHYQFRATFGNETWRLTIPFRRPHVKTPYVKASLQAIDEIIALETGKEEESEASNDDTE